MNALPVQTWRTVNLVLWLIPSAVMLLLIAGPLKGITVEFLDTVDQHFWHWQWIPTALFMLLLWGIATVIGLFITTVLKALRERLFGA